MASSQPGTRRSAPSYAGKARLTAEDRRRQLVEVGLLLLRRTPLYALTLDEVAAEAGISRGLLFHYFPTKTDYFSALVRSAGRRVLHNTEPDPDAEPGDRLRGMVRGFVEQIDRRRESYLSIARGTAGPELRVSEVYDELRAELTERVLRTLDVEDVEEDRRSVVHAWWGYVEDRAIAWSAQPPDRRTASSEDLTEHCVSALDALLDLPVT